MKLKLTLFSLVAFLYTGMLVNGQEIKHPKPNVDQIPFGKKLPAPTLIQRQKFLPTAGSNLTNGLSKKSDQQSLGTRPDNDVQRLQPLSQNYSSTQAKYDRNSYPSDFHLTKDINAQHESDPQNYNSYIYPSEFAVLNNVSYFNANDGIHGLEPWRSDGTRTGTYLVKDINPGEASSGIDGGITAANGKLYFPGITADGGEEPWVSNGTQSGTHLLVDINPGVDGSFPSQFVAAKNKVFFVANSNQLWKTDGTSAGTSMIKDLSVSDGAFQIFQSTAVNDLLFFTASDFFNGRQLWRSDGTEAGTYIVKQIGTYLYDFVAPLQLTKYNNKLFFSVDDGLGRRLWSSDGTPDGTGYATADDNIFMQTDYLAVNVKNPFPVINNVLYFAGLTYADGGGLYKFNAFNNHGIDLVTDLTSAPDVDFITPVDFAVVGSRLYFKVINSIGGYHDELWKSDGSAASSKLIKTFLPGEVTFDHNNGNGLLYFNKVDPVYGNELWKSDGTEHGTVMVKDIWEGLVSAAPYYLTECNGKLLFNAADKDNGASLYATDGTAAGTKLVKEINTSSTSGSNAGGFSSSDMIVSKNGAFFNAFDRAHGYELYRSGGKDGNTELVKDIIEGEGSSYPNAFLSKNGLTYFRANNTDQSAGFAGSTIYKTDGTKNGTKKIIDVNNAYFLGYNVTDNGLVYYVTFDLVTFTYDLWRTDGSTTGTYLLASNLYYNPYVVTSGNSAYFVAGDESDGYELWKSNGTVGSTKMVKDIFQGPEGSNPYSLFVYDKNIYFGAYDGSGFYNSFWKSDGTAAGTIKLKETTPAYGNSPDDIRRLFCVSNHTLYFNAVDYNALVYQGAELWKTNGSPNGTKLVKDINVNADSNPNNLTDVNGALFFLAYDDINGNELWSSYGTAASTRIVKDITPGFIGSFISNLVSSQNKLYFLKDFLLWQSDGREQGTHPVEDGGLEGLTSLQNLMGSDDNLFFSAYTYKYGTELYTNANDGDHKKNNENSVAALNKVTAENATTGSMTAMIFPNPATNILNINIASPNMEVTRLTVSGADGKLFISQDVNGKRVARIDVSHLQAGVYFVKLVGGTSGAHAVQKFIKE